MEQAENMERLTSMLKRMWRVFLRFMWLDKPYMAKAGDITLYGYDKDLTVSIGRYTDHSV